MNEFYKEIMNQSIQYCADSLRLAKQLAKQNRDVEALIIIAERYATFAGKLKDIDKGGNFMLGFNTIVEEEDINE
jgi:hypothetical protein